MDTITLTLLAYQQPKTVVSFVIGYTTCWDHALCCAMWLRDTDDDRQYVMQGLHAVDPTAHLPVTDCSSCKSDLRLEPDCDYLSWAYPTAFHEFTR